MEWTSEDKRKANLDNVAKDILYKTLNNNIFSKIQTCTTAKEIWEKLTQLHEGNEETKENKLIVALQKFEFIRMKPEETIDEFDERFNSLVIELTRLGKEYSNRELTLKVMRALPKEWDVKTMAMQESKDLKKLELHDLFANLKAYEFELETRAESEPSTSQPTKALAATIPEQSPSSSKLAEEISNDVMSLFIKNLENLCESITLNPPLSIHLKRILLLLMMTNVIIVTGRVTSLLTAGSPSWMPRSNQIVASVKTRRRGSSTERRGLRNLRLLRKTKVRGLTQIQRNPAQEPPHQVRAKMKYTVSWQITLRRYLISPTLNLHGRT
ncbi:hypothetical protein F511_13315 [Dorcoceras hygrometricum]|uniref:UBN2 domain-containing protein n=1 Tax=Dorcoceras hygrometricum TaxID=472368 RepID=A0A2Z7DD71_9LAMI|nr:hypothetical protein F511_13315 [Dorcoceras hygrometricum]